MDSKERQYRRKLFWDKNDGRCFYCGQKTILPEMLPFGIASTTPPPNMATIDHVISRNHTLFIHAKQNDFIVLCCLDCNHLKSVVETRGNRKDLVAWKRRITKSALTTITMIEKSIL